MDLPALRSDLERRPGRGSPINRRVFLPGVRTKPSPTPAASPLNEHVFERPPLLIVG